MGEISYQAKLVKKLRNALPGCQILRTDPTQEQGIPDWLILFNGRWGMLEVKASADSPTQPNQEYHVERYNQMGFARFVYPENEEQVLRDLQSALGAGRPTRLSKSK